jgi:hypothetical protein
VQAVLPVRPGLDEARDFGRRLLWVTAAGLVVRTAFLLLEPHAEFAGDEPTWIFLGVQGLAKLRRPFSPLGSPILFYPPGYPYFLGALHALFGTLQAVKWVQVFLGALLVHAVGRVGFLAFSPRVGLAAAGMAAFYPELVWFSTHFWSETLFLVLLWWAFERTLLSRRSDRLGVSVSAGLLWGLAALTRETALYFIPFAALWLLLERRARAAAAFLVAASLTVAPWTLRNWIVFGAFVPVSTFGAHALWQGNTLLTIDEFYRRTDSVPGPIAQYHLAREEGIRAIRERQPLWLLEKIGHEMPLLWGPETHISVLLDNRAYGPLGSVTRDVVRATSVLPYLAVVCGALPGLVALSLEGESVLLVLFFFYYNALHVVSYGQDRFRLPVMPVLFLAAAMAWTAYRGGTFPRLGPWRRALLWALALATVAVVLPGLL